MLATRLLNHLHLGQSDGGASVDPGAGKVHHLDLVASKQNMCLAMSNGNHVLSVTLDVIALDVLAGALVKQVFEVGVLVCDGTSHCPHGVSETNWGTLVRGPATFQVLVTTILERAGDMGKKNVLQIHGGEVASAVNHGHGCVHLFKVNLVQLVNGVLRRQRLFQAKANHFPGKRVARCGHVSIHIGGSAHVAHLDVGDAHAEIVEAFDVSNGGRVVGKLPSIMFAVHGAVGHIERCVLRHWRHAIDGSRCRRGRILCLEQRLNMLC